MRCARDGCDRKLWYEFDGFAFCRPHGETYLIERRYGQLEREIEDYFWSVMRENKWWADALLDGGPIDELVEELAHMPKDERMRRLFGANPIPEVEYELVKPLVTIAASASQAVRALDEMGKRLAQIKLPDFSKGDSMEATWTITSE